MDDKSVSAQGVVHPVEGGKPFGCHAVVRSRRDSLSSAERKQLPIVRGVLDYFPDALLEVATASLAGQSQHLNGTGLHWDRTKSTDEADALVRHLLDRGKLDTDGVRHSAKVAWRALALLQREIEEERKAPLDPPTQLDDWTGRPPHGAVITHDVARYPPWRWVRSDGEWAAYEVDGIWRKQ